MAPTRSQPLLGGVAPIEACADDCNGPRKRGCWTWDRIFLAGTIAEFLGTFFVNFFTSATMILFYYWSQQNECCAASVLLGIATAIVFGLATFVTVYAIGWLRGAHLSPWVTMAYVIFQKTSPLYGILLVVAQFLAGIASAGILNFLVGAYVPSLATPTPLAGLDDGRLFFVLALAYMFVMLYVLMRSKPCRMNAIAYGITLLVVSVVTIPLTGSTFSPFHHLGLSIFSGIWNSFAIYFFAPLVGAVIAILVFMFLLWPMKQDLKTAKCEARKRCGKLPVIVGGQ